MSDTTYSRVELHDLGDSSDARAPDPPQPAASSASSRRSLDFEKPQVGWTWREDWTRESLLNSAEGVKEAAYNAVPVIRSATINAVPLVKAGVRTRKFRRHAFAFLVFFILGMLPTIVYFGVLPDPFVAHPVQCESHDNGTYGNSIEEDRPGIEGLFTIDRVGGKFPFWLAKLLDTLWDLFVARGMQFMATWISYIVFSSALIRTIEASPVPYRTFTGIALNGASLGTIISLLADLRRYSRKRAIWLFAYGAVAFSYVLAMPTLLSTMTGYISASSAYAQIPGTSQFVPTSLFETGYAFVDLPGVRNNTCLTSDRVSPLAQRSRDQYYTCNSTCVTQSPHSSFAVWKETGELFRKYETKLEHMFYASNCTYFRNETYTSEYYGYTYTTDGTGPYISGEDSTFNCADPVTLTIDGRNITVSTALDYNYTHYYYGYCYNDTGYATYEGRCLPDTNASPAYQWGFSAMLTSVVLIAHALWACSLYAIWIDAELGSRLVARGCALGQLRGALVVAGAAERTTGLRGAELRALGPGEVEGLLARRGAVVGVGVLGGGEKEEKEEEEGEEGEERDGEGDGERGKGG